VSPTEYIDNQYTTLYIYGNHLKLKTTRSLSFKAFDKLLNVILLTPHSKNLFFWRDSSRIFVRFVVYSKQSLDDILNMCMVLATLNPNGQVSCFTDDKIYYNS